MEFNTSAHGNNLELMDLNDRRINPYVGNVDVSCKGKAEDERFNEYERSGKTLLDDFAGQMMHNIQTSNTEYGNANKANLCYNQAEAMLAERAKRLGL